MLKTILLSIILISVGYVIHVNLFMKPPQIKKVKSFKKIQQPIRYVALGDSYTEGANELPDDSFPAQLTKKLQSQGIDISLAANPAVSGYTTRDLIDRELPVLNESQANLVTILIGANDLAGRGTADEFRKNFSYILDEVLKTDIHNEGVVVLTIPDFSVTPVGTRFGYGLPVNLHIKEFNRVIYEESQKRNVTVVDLFEITQDMGKDKSLINPDGLHPSSKEYARWVDLLVPVIKQKIR